MEAGADMECGNFGVANGKGEREMAGVLMVADAASVKREPRSNQV